MINAVYRFLIDWHLSNDSSVPEWLAKKAEKDAALSQYLDGELGLNRLLSAPKHNPQTGSSQSDLAERILAKLDSDEEDESPVVMNPPIPFRTITYSLGGVAAILVLGISLWNKDVILEEDSPVVTVATVTEVKPTPANTTLSVDLEKINEDWKNPLDQEIEFVVSDARDALRFLATSFLPEEIAKESLGENGSKS